MNFVVIWMDGDIPVVTGIFDTFDEAKNEQQAAKDALVDEADRDPPMMWTQMTPGYNVWKCSDDSNGALFLSEK